jgi:chitinase
MSSWGKPATPAPTSHQSGRRNTRAVLIAAGVAVLVLAAVIITIVATAGRPGSPPTPPGPRRIGYFMQSGVYARGFTVKQLDATGMAAKLTQVDYAFGNIDAAGHCFMSQQAGQSDPWADYQMRYTADASVDGTADAYNASLAGSFNQLKELKARYPQLKVYISLGGWTWSRYLSDAALPANRAATVASCIDLYLKGNLPKIGREPQGGQGAGFGVFDGIDLDWEWPAAPGAPGNVVRPEDKANFVALLQEFRSQLDAYGASVHRSYGLSAFLPADPAVIGAGIDPAVFASLTFATIQGYDFANASEPTTNHQSQLRDPAANPASTHLSVADAISRYLAAGAPADKLDVGIPAYGRGWTGVANINNGLYQAGTPAPGTYEQGVEDFKVIDKLPGTVFRDDEDGAVWKYDGTTFWSYDDPALISAKGRYVQQNGLGGLTLWPLSGDDGRLVTAMQAGLP